jgi:hypothetical protein
MSRTAGAFVGPRLQSSSEIGGSGKRVGVGEVGGMLVGAGEDVEVGPSGTAVLADVALEVGWGGVAF